MFSATYTNVSLIHAFSQLSLRHRYLVLPKPARPCSAVVNVRTVVNWDYMRVLKLSSTVRRDVSRSRPPTIVHAVSPPVSSVSKRSFGFAYTPPPFMPESPPRLDVDLPKYDGVECPHIDVAIAGAGPAGVATAARIASQGLSVLIVDPSPLQHWPNNYGVWCDEFEAMGLDDCFERVWTKANVWVGEGDER